VPHPGLRRVIGVPELWAGFESGARRGGSADGEAGILRSLKIIVHGQTFLARHPKRAARRWTNLRSTRRRVAGSPDSNRYCSRLVPGHFGRGIDELAGEAVAELFDMLALRKTENEHVRVIASE
jgi:hypothetical protein